MMKKGIGTGILVTLGIVFTIINPLVMGILAIPTWIYLVWSVRKRNGDKSPDLIESKLVFSEKHKKMFRTFQLVAAIAFLVSLVNILLHNFGPDILGLEESVSFFIGIAATYIFIFATAAGLILFLKARQHSSL